MPIRLFRSSPHSRHISLDADAHPECSITITREGCVLVVDSLALDDLPDANEQVDDLNFGIDVSGQFML
jgi:hypothetical protein